MRAVLTPLFLTAFAICGLEAPGVALAQSEAGPPTCRSDDPDPEAARRAREEGARLFARACRSAGDSGGQTCSLNCDRALARASLAAFQRMCDAGDQEALLALMAAHYALGNWVSAAEAADAAREEIPRIFATSPRAVRNWEAIEPCVATLTVRTEVAGAVAFPDGRVRPTNVPMRVRPGASRLLVRAEGHDDQTVEVDLERGEARELEIELQPVSEPPRVSPEQARLPEPRASSRAEIPLQTRRRSQPSEFYETPWFWVGVGLVAAAAIGVAVGVAAWDPTPQFEGSLMPGHIALD